MPARHVDGPNPEMAREMGLPDASGEDSLVHRVIRHIGLIASQRIGGRSEDQSPLRVEVELNEALYRRLLPRA